MKERKHIKWWLIAVTALVFLFFAGSCSDSESTGTPDTSSSYGETVSSPSAEQAAAVSQSTSQSTSQTTESTTTTTTTTTTTKKSTTTTKTTTKKATTTKKKTTTTQRKDNDVSSMVYVTPTGKRYHSKVCGNGDYYKVSLSEAKSRGLTPCKKCYG